MTIQEKREKLAESDADNWEYSTFYDIALDGCKGYNNMTDELIEELYSNIFD